MKKILCLLLTVLLTLTSAAAVSAADVSGTNAPETIAECEPPVGDIDDIRTPAPVQNASSGSLLVATRSINEIREFYSKHPTTYSGAMFATEPVNSGDYEPGELSKGAVGAALNMLNVIRYTAGIDGDIECDEQTNKQMQASALLMAVNKTTSYTEDALKRPAGMSDELWELGKAEISHANRNKSDAKMTDTILNVWLSNSTTSGRKLLGFRRWLLNPAMKTTGFGYNDGYFAMYAFNKDRESGYTRVAWPAQNTPSELFKTTDPWSVSMGETVTRASIKVTANDGKTWHFDATEGGDATTDDGFCTINNTPYGLTGAIIFAPKDISTDPSAYYAVDITYNDDMKLSYGVRFFSLQTEVGYSVSFNANGGSGAPKVLSKETGGSVEIPKDVPTRDNYSFKGWALSPGAKDAVYQPGDKYYDDANVTLYAVWKALYQSLDKVAVERISGENRFKTAISISREAFDSADTVIIANGMNYPDALAGVTLAKAASAPILLCTSSAISSDVLDEVKRLGANKAYILGGTSAVGEEVEKKLEDFTDGIVRLAGSDRNSTAVEIAKELERLTAKAPECVYLACDSNFPDALAISPVAAINGEPVIYMPRSGAPSKATESYLKALKEAGCDHAVILGGELAVSAEGRKNVENLGISTERIQGANRYETALNICSHFDSRFSGDSIVLATGRSFPDALAGGVLAAKTGAPVLLIDENHVADGAKAYAESRKLDKIIVLGGEKAVSSKAVDQLTGGSSASTTTKSTSTTSGTKATSGTSSTSSTKATSSTKTTSATAKTDVPTSNGKTVYLTFDNGPSARTKDIVEVLDKYKVKGTFFISHRSGLAQSVKAIVSSGHTLGLRSYVQDYASIYGSEDKYYYNLERLEKYVKEQAGVTTKYLRFPGGSGNTISKKYKAGIMTALTKSVTEKGYRYYDWNVDCGDSISNSVPKDVIVANVKKGVAANTQKKIDSMVLMTDAANKKTTISALSEIIEWLQSEGYSIKAVDDSAPTFHQNIQN